MTYVPRWAAMSAMRQAKSVPDYQKYRLDAEDLARYIADHASSEEILYVLELAATFGYRAAADQAELAVRKAAQKFEQSLIEKEEEGA